jgi:eukaryotic-like serine/threonine-protein kinase
MPDPGLHHCPACGQALPPDVPEGICPACELRGALEMDATPERLSGTQTANLNAAPPAGNGASRPAISEGEGTVIGRYKLLEMIGEGGFGVVYMAEQEEPVRRRVALKILKLGMDTKEVIARFEAERQALALMDHPSIAKVFDGGATDTGRPYFVMELVRGIRITDFCDQKRFSTRQRLDIFMQICQAVQHAHQKGIIHRDLKPSNVLVTINDGVPVPKVIDFGIAKATGQRLTDKTLFTRFHQLIGTPAYMSPEQVEMTSVDIDTRSDIYSLGVLLYELLTGKTPFDVAELLEAGMEAMRRIIREKEPPRPSARLSTLAEADRTTTAKCRDVETRKLIHLVRGDLDWIVMKCLEKDRARRYETANGLAMDIRRHMSSETVSARSPSMTYRFGKFARRNKGMLVSAAGVAVALLIGTAVSFWQAQLAKKAKWHTEAILARTYADNGVRKLNEGNRYGLLDLMDAVTTAEHNPELHESLVLLWSGWYRRWESRVLARWGYRPVPNYTGFRAQGPDGRMIASSSDPHTVQLWRMDTGQLSGPPLAHGTNVVQGSRSEIDHVGGFSLNGRVLATATVDGKIFLWDTTTCRLMRQPLVHGEQLNALALSADGQFLARSSGSTIKIWQTATGKLFWEVQHGGGVTKLAFSHDGRILASGGASRVWLWDVATGTSMAPPLGITPGIPRLAFSQDGRYLASADLWALGVRIWALDSMPPRERILKTRGVNSIAFSPDGTLLAVGGRFGDVNIFSTASGEEKVPSWKLTGRVVSVSFSSDGRFLATGTTDGFAQIWATDSGKPAEDPIDFPSQVFANFISGDTLAFQFGNGSEIIKMDASPLSAKTLPHPEPGEALAYNVSGDLFAIGTGSQIELWDPENGRKTGIGFSVQAQPRALMFGSGGKSIVVLAKGGKLQIWNADTGEFVTPALQRGKPTYSIAISRSGKFLAGASDGQAGLWKIDSGEIVKWPVLTGGLTTMAFSSDDSLLAIGTLGWDTILFDTLTGEPTGSKSHHNERVACVGFHPNGKVIAVSTEARTTELIDLATSRPVGRKLNNQTICRDMTFNPDGTLLATAEGSKVELWHIDGGPVHSGISLSHPSDIHALAFSPDGRHLAVGIHGGTRIWDLPEVPTDSKAVQLKTLITLSCRQDANGSLEAIPWEEWQSLRQKLHELGHSPKPNGTQWAEKVDWGTYIRLKESLDEVNRYAIQQDWPSAHRVIQPFIQDKTMDWNATEKVDESIIQKAGALCLAVEDRETHLALCRSQMGRFTEDSHPNFLERSAKTCLLAPYPLPDDLRKQAAQWARWAVKNRDRIPAKYHGWMYLVKGMAEYRYGSYAEAFDTLALAEGNTDLGCKTMALNFRALAAYQVGHPALATRLLKQAEEVFGPVRQEFLSDATRWWDGLNAELALKEAEQVIRSDTASDPQKSSLRIPDVDTNWPPALLSEALLERSEKYKRLGRFAEAKADNLAGRGIPPRDPRAKPQLVDLSLFYNYALTNNMQDGVPGNDAAGLPQGLQPMGEIEFDIRGLVQLAGTELAKAIGMKCPSLITNIPLNRVAPRLHFLHGTSYSETDGAKIGFYILHYVDGQEEKLPIVYGEHLRDWWRNPRGDNKDAVQAPVVWTGENAAVRRSNGSLRLYLMTCRNPRPDVEIKSIDFVSTMTKCAPFLIAITAEP